MYIFLYTHVIMCIPPATALISSKDNILDCVKPAPETFTVHRKP